MNRTVLTHRRARITALIADKNTVPVSEAGGVPNAVRGHDDGVSARAGGEGSVVACTDSTVAAADAGGVRTALGVYHTTVDGDGSAIVCVLTGADARAAGTAA